MKFTKLKSNKGVTLADVAIAIMIILLFVGIITTIFLTIYETQSQTKVDSVAMLFVVQAMERIDKLGYDEIQESTLQSIITNMRSDFSIPDSFDISIRIDPDPITDSLVKTVEFNLGYNLFGKDKNILIKTLKVKEYEGES